MTKNTNKPDKYLSPEKFEEFLQFINDLKLGYGKITSLEGGGHPRGASRPASKIGRVRGDFAERVRIGYLKANMDSQKELHHFYKKYKNISFKA